MNKISAIIGFVAVAQALKLSEQPLSNDDLLKLAQQQGVIFDDREIPYIPPKARSDTFENTMAQTSQYTLGCNDTFARLSGSAVPDVNSVISTGTPYTDSSYSQAIAMYGLTNVVSWTKMGTYFPSSKGYSLFKNDLQSSINVGDTIQGYLGDCWVLSTVASMAASSQRIWSMFDQKKMNAAGAYSLRMYDMGVPVSIVLDDFLPINPSWGTNTFAWTDADLELWPLLVEKAYSKLNGDYNSIQGGFPMDAGNQMLGTGGSWYYLNTKTAAAIFTDVLAWTKANHIITCGIGAQATGGLVANHAYSFLGAYAVTGTVGGVSQSLQLVKVRNPWGATEWTGAFNDADPFWAANPTVASSVGYVNGNDGAFFMTVADFAQNFQFVSMNYDPTNMYQSYWLAPKGAADTVGVAGNTNFCGITCKQSQFTITSPVAQTIYLAVNLHTKKQYVADPCTQATTSTAVPYKYMYAAVSYGTTGSESRIWNAGAAYFQPIVLTAGQTISLTVELDWTRNNIRKDFSVTAWATSSAVAISESSGKVSDKYYLATTTGGASTVIVNPIVTPTPTPTPTPVVETCSAFVNVISYDSTRQAMILTNGCNTRNATFKITLAATQWANVQQYDAGHAAPTCVTSGTMKQCSFTVAFGGVSKVAIALFAPTWDGNYSSTVALS